MTYIVYYCKTPGTTGGGNNAAQGGKKSGESVLGKCTVADAVLCGEAALPPPFTAPLETLQ